MGREAVGPQRPRRAARAERGARAAGEEWQGRFLAALERFANARLAAEIAGVDHSTAYDLRGRDSGFARAWLAALERGRRRVRAQAPAAPGEWRAPGEGRASGDSGAQRRRREEADARPLVARVSKNGGAQFVRAGEGRWTPRAERIVLDRLQEGWGVRRSAASAGFSAVAVYARRARDPAFATRWAEARALGVERNEQLLIDSVQWSLDPEAVEAAEDAPRPSIAEAIRIVVMNRPRESGARPGRPPLRREPTIEEVRDEIFERIQALRREREGKQE